MTDAHRLVTLANGTDVAMAALVSFDDTATQASVNGRVLRALGSPGRHIGGGCVAKPDPGVGESSANRVTVTALLPPPVRLIAAPIRHEAA